MCSKVAEIDLLIVAWWRPSEAQPSWAAGLYHATGTVPKWRVGMATHSAQLSAPSDATLFHKRVVRSDLFAPIPIVQELRLARAAGRGWGVGLSSKMSHKSTQWNETKRMQCLIHCHHWTIVSWHGSCIALYQRT